MACIPFFLGHSNLLVHFKFLSNLPTSLQSFSLVSFFTAANVQVNGYISNLFSREKKKDMKDCCLYYCSRTDLDREHTFNKERISASQPSNKPSFKQESKLNDYQNETVN